MEKKILGKSLLNQKCSIWKEMTENNFHTEVRIDICEFLKYNDICDFLKVIHKHEEENGYIRQLDLKLRYELTCELRKRIEEDFGNEIYVRIYDCL